MSEKKILLGFEVGSGREVKLSLHHTVITGMTQLSGKTTALTAIIDRSKLRAIAFITKRGESGFQNYHEIPPFFIEQSNWQYVSSILEAYLKEKMKFERSWIMKATKGAKSLKDVLANIKFLRKKARPDSLTDSVYMTLEEYLGEIIPQIERFTFTKTLNLEGGINVMDLSAMTLEMRSLVIRSVMEYVNEKMKNVVVVIPEAWELLPQGRTTPVKLFAEVFIRKGASIGNYLFIDSQDIAGIDKAPLRSCNNWIMGRQRETHEVERLRSVIGKKVSEDEIRALKLGHFIAVLGDDLKHVYVLPIGVPPEMGRRVAMGLIGPEKVREYLQSQGKSDDEVYREKFEQSEREKEELQRQLDELKAAPKTSAETDDEKVKKLKELYELIKNGKLVDTQSADYINGIIAEAEQRGVEKGKVKAEAEITTIRGVAEKAVNQAGEAEKKAREAEDRNRELESTLASVEGAVNKIESLRVAVAGFLKPIIVEVVKEQGLVKGNTSAAPPTNGINLQLTVEKPSIEVVNVIKKAEVSTETLQGKVYLVYVENGMPLDKTFSPSDLKPAFEKHGWGWSNTHASKVNETLNEMTRGGLLELKLSGRRPDYRVILSPEDAKARGLIKFSEKIE